MKVRYALQAQHDIASIYNHISLDNPIAAQRVEDRIRAAIDMLETFPGLGVTTNEEDVRRMPLGRFPYIVFYRVNESAGEIHVLRVVHGARVRDPDRVP